MASLELEEEEATKAATGPPRDATYHVATEAQSAKAQNGVTPFLRVTSCRSSRLKEPSETVSTTHHIQENSLTDQVTDR